MGDEAVVLGGLVVLAGLVVLWHLTFSVDPRVHPHPFVLRWVEPRWERWADLDWDAKMRIFHRRQVVNWVFVILVVGLLVYLFSLAVRAGAPQPATTVAAAAAAAVPAATLAVDGEPFGVAVTPDGKYALVTLASAGEVALYSRPGYRLVGKAHVGGQPCGIALTHGGKVALVAVFARRGELVALSVPALKVLGAVAAGAYPIEVAVTPDGRQAFVIDGGAVAAVADSARFARPPVASTVTFVSTAAVLAGRPALLGTVASGLFPREFALSPRGHQLLLTEFRSEKVAVFDVGSLPQPR